MVYMKENEDRVCKQSSKTLEGTRISQQLVQINVVITSIKTSIIYLQCCTLTIAEAIPHHDFTIISIYMDT